MWFVDQPPSIVCKTRSRPNYHQIYGRLHGSVGNILVGTPLPVSGVYRAHHEVQFLEGVMFRIFGRKMLQILPLQFVSDAEHI